MDAEDLDEKLDDDLLVRRITTGTVVSVTSDLISCREHSFEDYNMAEEEVKEESNHVRITERGTEEENRSE